jgi:hypothetical protein
VVQITVPFEQIDGRQGKSALPFLARENGNRAMFDPDRPLDLDQLRACLRAMSDPALKRWGSGGRPHVFAGSEPGRAAAAGVRHPAGRSARGVATKAPQGFTRMGSENWILPRTARCRLWNVPVAGRRLTEPGSSQWPVANGNSSPSLLREPRTVQNCEPTRAGHRERWPTPWVFIGFGG